MKNENTIKDLTLVLESARKSRFDHRAPQLTFGEVQRRTRNINIREHDYKDADAQVDKMVVAESLDVFIEGTHVGRAGWLWVSPRWGEPDYPEFWVEGPHIPSKKRARRWGQSKNRRESKRAANLVKFTKVGFRLDNPAEQFSNQLAEDTEANEARRTLASANTELRQQRRWQTRHLFDKVMAILATVKVDVIDDDVKTLIDEYETTIALRDASRATIEERSRVIEQRTGHVRVEV